MLMKQFFKGWNLTKIRSCRWPFCWNHPDDRTDDKTLQDDRTLQDHHSNFKRNGCQRLQQLQTTSDYGQKWMFSLGKLFIFWSFFCGCCYLFQVVWCCCLCVGSFLWLLLLSFSGCLVLLFVLWRFCVVVVYLFQVVVVCHFEVVLVLLFIISRFVWSCWSSIGEYITVPLLNWHNQTCLQSEYYTLFYKVYFVLTK